ncbi:MAG: hypothetical protein QNK65_06480 [Flavobacteriales bacterium]
MARFIKFNCTAAATQPEVLIAIDQIAAVTTNGAGTATTIQLNTSGTANWVITHTIALAGVSENSVVEAIYRAMQSNPGGYVSTVGSPVLTAQAPAAQSGAQGRTVVTAPATFVTYVQNAWTP